MNIFHSLDGLSKAGAVGGFIHWMDFPRQVLLGALSSGNLNSFPREAVVEHKDLTVDPNTPA